MTEKVYETITGTELRARINAVTMPRGEEVCWASDEERAITRQFAERFGTEFPDTGTYYLRSTVEPFPITRTDIDIVALAKEVLGIRCQEFEGDDAEVR